MRRPPLLPASALAFAAAALLSTALSSTTLLSTIATAQKPVTERRARCSPVWVSEEDAIEKFLAGGKVDKMETIPIGVTKPQRATLEPSGPASRFAWK